MSKGGKLKPNTSLELYFVNKRNVCAPRPLDVSSARKHACFARESEASFSRSKIYDLDRSIPPQQMFDLRLGFRLSWSLLDSYNLCIAFGYYSIDINIAIYFNLAFTMYMIQINKYVIATYATICNFLKPTNQYSKYSKKKVGLDGPNRSPNVFKFPSEATWILGHSAKLLSGFQTFNNLVIDIHKLTSRLLGLLFDPRTSLWSRINFVQILGKVPKINWVLTTLNIVFSVIWYSMSPWKLL